MAAKKKPAKKKPARKSSQKKSTAKKPAAKKRTPLKARVKRPLAKVKRPKRPARPALPVRENPEALKLAQQIAGVALDKKGEEVTIIDVRARGSAVGYDYVVIASGDSDRQLEAMYDALDEKLKAQGTRALSVEAAPDWVLVDYADVVAHFFTPEKRHLYDLEGYWSDAPRVELLA